MVMICKPSRSPFQNVSTSASDPILAPEITAITPRHPLIPTLHNLHCPRPKPRTLQWISAAHPFQRHSHGLPLCRTTSNSLDNNPGYVADIPEMDIDGSAARARRHRTTVHKPMTFAVTDTIYVSNPTTKVVSSTGQSPLTTDAYC